MKRIMKQIALCTLSFVALSFAMTGCESFLNEPNETKLTTDFLISSPEGLQSTVVAMYGKDREQFRNSGDGESVVYLALLMGDDITASRFPYLSIL